MKVSLLRCVAALATLAALGAPAQAQLFSEDFNDGLAASRWSIVSQQEGVVGPDGSVDFAFDYSTLGLSNPNGTADTTGAFLQFNNTDQVGNEGESYSIYPNGQSFSGTFFVDLDMFVYNDGLGGSTEHGMAGVFLDNANPVSPYEFGVEGGPLAWVYSGEGGDGSGDLGTYEEGNASATGYASLGEYDDLPAGTIPGFETGGTASLGPAAPPNDRGSWVDVRIESDGTTVNWLLNGVVVDSYDNSGGFYTAGNILIGGMDVFNSSNAGGGAIVDNVVVGVPEPATWALAGLAAMGVVALRRRK